MSVLPALLTEPECERSLHTVLLKAEVVKSKITTSCLLSGTQKASVPSLKMKDKNDKN